MKKSKFFLAIAAVVLGVVGFVSTKASKKFTGISAARVLAPVPFTITNLPTAHFTNVFVSGTTKTVYLKTVGGTSWTLVTSSAANAKKVYYH